MNAYKIKVALSSRVVEMIVKPGIVATMEVGSHVNRERTPKNKVVAIIDATQDILSAWIQIADYIDGNAKITHEGIVNDMSGSLAALSQSAARTATIEKLSQVPTKTLESQAQLKFGTMACCTSYGNGCYVTCCNSCCSDPTGCPGASCCA